MLDSFFSQLEDGKSLKVSLPMLGETIQERIPCTFEKDTFPFFLTNFQDGSVQLQEVDSGRRCTIFVDLAGQAFSIIANIDSVKHQQSLRLKAIELISHEQQRNYFRVDANTPVSASPLIPKIIRQNTEEWHLEGETIDLSGSGTLCAFPQPLEIRKRVRIDLVLPTSTMEVLNIIGHVVRCSQIDDSTYHIALHFEALTSEDREKIMACCFKLQREHLRMKVQVKNNP